MNTLTRTSVERIWDALHAAGYHPEPSRAGRFKALCPVHGDTHRSLSVTYNPARGMTLLHCFSCPATATDILTTLGLSLTDAYDAPRDNPHDRAGRPSRPATRPRVPAVPARIATRPVTELPRTGWATTATYDYTTSDATTVQRVQRRELTLGGMRHKKFVQQFRQPDGSYGWVKPDGFQPVFYRQPAVDQAIATGEAVWICEGEKDADNAVAAGVRSATTNAQGAGGFPQTLLGQLHGPVVIVADRDLAGYTRARTLRAALTARGSEVTVLLPATLDDKSDLSDHLAAGHTISDLIRPTDEDLDALILSTVTCKILTGMRRDLDEIDAHAHLTAAAGDPDGSHRAAACFWADRIIRTWDTHHREQLAGYAHRAGLTAEGHRATHRLDRAIAYATGTIHNLHAAHLTNEGAHQ